MAKIVTKALLIQWKDAEGGTSGWVDGETSSKWALDDNSAMCVSMGFLVAETAQYITLAGSIVRGHFGELQKIPRGMIVKKKVIQTWK